MLKREFIANTRSTLILSISNKSSDIQKLLTREKKEGSFRLHSFCAIHDADFHSERVFFFKLKEKDTIEKISFILDKVDFIFLGENPTQNDLNIFEELKRIAGIQKASTIFISL